MPGLSGAAYEARDRLEETLVKNKNKIEKKCHYEHYQLMKKP